MGKATEANVKTALAEIKGQTEVLNKIMGRHLSRLTKAATKTDTAQAETFALLSQAMDNLTSTPRLQAPGDPRPEPDYLTAGLGFLHYVGLTNLLAQTVINLLPDDADGELDEMGEYYRGAATNYLRESYADFTRACKYFDDQRPEDLRAMPRYQEYVKTREAFEGVMWSPDESTEDTA